MVFRDRADAGRMLAKRLERYADRDDVLVLGLPRGGVPVAYEVARALHAPLDVFVVRKLGLPGQPELAMGAIATGGVRVLNPAVAEDLEPEVIEAATAREREELERRESCYRGARPAANPRGRTVILIDDGLATGSTMRAAVAAVRQQKPARVVVAVPVGAAQTCGELLTEADDVICLKAPERFYAVGVWYEDFSATNDDEVRALLARAAEERSE